MGYVSTREKYISRENTTSAERQGHKNALMQHTRTQELYTPDTIKPPLPPPPPNHASNLRPQESFHPSPPSAGSRISTRE
ncbi:hypothetical protein BO71DRAFT_147746 [Aspergillus ellipticus CBS 707.79]|uniref:Uncharacterized protein n=1 Tax=Aspergillus ellipticus CBS 707.79 TaxID=1448320 RepID=A0A319CUQ8_9EURO|nr:hypothetical protein BO71DRAFT_147746 [Aspergillus ellipticus CBS 707.79]